MTIQMHRLVALALICAFAFGARGTQAASAQDQTLTTITVAAPPADDATPILYAIKAGLFRRAGLDVQFQTLTSGSAIAQAVAGGAIQIGLSSAIPLILAHVKNVPFQIVAPAGVYVDSAPYGAMVVRSDSPFHTGADLNGKIVGVAALKDTGGLASLAWIEQTGGNPQTIREIEVPYSSMVAALEDGRIDAVSLIQPGLAQALATGKTKIIGKSYTAIAKRFLVSAWFGRTDFIAANPDAVRRFARVLHDASVYANAHHDQTAPLLADFTKVDVDAIRAATREVFGETLDAGDLQRVIDAGVKYKFIDAGFDARELLSPG
jgi:NitT/TauT family transport system substrate-binding protein